MMAGETPTASDDEFEVAFTAACCDVIAKARHLAPRIRALDIEAAREMGDFADRRMAEAGATEDEREHYSKRILLMVLAEHQA